MKISNGKKQQTSKKKEKNVQIFLVKMCKCKIYFLSISHEIIQKFC